jgi:hypothetical protein
MIDKWTSILSRIFFTLAFIIFVIAVLSKIAILFGWNMNWMHFDPGRLFEFSAMMMVFVIVMLLRQIREKLGK